MANAGKKRALPSSGTSSKKKQKLANKQAHKGKSSSSLKTGSALASKQKSAEDFTAYGAGSSASKDARRPQKRAQKPSAGTEQALLRDKKGKATIKQFVELPEHLKKRRQAASSAATDDAAEEESDADDLGIEDMLANDEDDDEDDFDAADQAAGPSQKQDFAQRSKFLGNLNMQELSKSRAYLLSEHKASKPQTASSKRHKELPKVGRAEVQVNSDDEENLDDLDEDDFANMKDSDFDDDDDDEKDSLDGELSAMSDAEDEDVEFGSDDGDSDLDSEVGDSEASELDEEEGEEGESWAGLDGSDSGDESGSGSSHTISDDEDLEDRYAALHQKKAKREAEEAKNRKTKLPVFGDASSDASEDEDDASDSEDDDEEADINASAKPKSVKFDKTAKSRVAHAPVVLSDESASESEDDQAKYLPKPNPLGARFGRPAVSSVLEIPDRMERFVTAREELAVLGREIMAEPELGMNLLRRLLSFAMPVFHANTDSQKASGIPVDPPIRSLAMLSLLAVFMDIVPGYRIRPVTEKEKAMRATQAVLQQREYEEGLVNTYRRFLETCEEEVKANSGLAPVALRCMCECLKEKSHFNYANNILEVLVKTLGRRRFDQSSEACVSTIAGLLRDDPEGQLSLQTVLLLSRTVKARGYNIHPAALSCLLHLQFPDLGIRASTDSVDRGPYKPRGKEHVNKKGKLVTGQYMNKKARKALQEKKAIEKEMAEAESEVKTEEVTRNNTETLKLLFAMYFRILKMSITAVDEAEANGKPLKEADLERIEQLLPAALEGLTRYAHLVNVDFFRDLLNVLRDVAARCKNHRTQVLCIGTALDLLTGQGEALNIDLSELVSRLYNLLVPLTLDPTIQEKPSSFYPPTLQKTLKAFSTSSYANQSTADVLFRVLAKLFLKTRMPNPQARVLAFCKRLSIACLHWPRDTSLRCMGFLRAMLTKERCLEALLNTEDRRRDGVYVYEAEQEGLANPDATVWWELALIEQSHFDEEIRAEASRLARWSKED